MLIQNEEIPILTNKVQHLEQQLEDSIEQKENKLKEMNKLIAKLQESDTKKEQV